MSVYLWEGGCGTALILVQVLETGDRSGEKTYLSFCFRGSEKILAQGAEEWVSSNNLFDWVYSISRFGDGSILELEFH